MKLDPAEQRRLGSAIASLAPGSPGSAGCPAPHTLWGAVRGELSGTEVREAIDHTTGCPACAEEWRLARELVRELDAATDGSPAVDVPRRRSSIWGWGAAAAAAVALVALTVPRMLDDTRPERPGAAFRQAVPAVEMLSALEPRAPLDRTRAVLRWRPGPAGTVYEVRLATEQLDLVARFDGLTVAELEIPAELLAEHAEGSTLVWQVRALLPSGEQVVGRSYPIVLH